MLAPVVVDRKGEHAQLMERMHAQGFIRARVDGSVIELEEPPKLKKNTKHTIEIVIDRVAVKTGHQQRLAESFETALELSEGIAKILILASGEEQQNREILFSSRYACPYCGYSLSELEPRLFSFNNPAGACPSCDGLGLASFFDPERVVYDAELSLSAGAIQGWDRRNVFYFNLLQCLANHYGFDVDTPFAEVPEPVRNAILFGSGNEKIQFTYLRGRGRRNVKRSHRFEGVVHNMERRYRDTESSSIREDLARFISSKACEQCGGSRLRLEARNVFIADHAIHDVTALSIGRAFEFFDTLAMSGNRAQIADKIVREIRERLSFLVNVGLEYLSIDRSAETLSGGEAQRIRLASQIGSGLVGVMYVLDEPSIGLHQRDNGRLLSTLTRLRDLGNTVVVVEHDEEAITSADHVLDLGPGAGIHGGQVVAQGTPSDIMASSQSLTGRYISGKLHIEVPAVRTTFDPKKILSVRGARGHNLQGIDIDIPVGCFTCVTGVSGSGKSTLINNTLYPAVAHALYKSQTNPAAHDLIDGIDQFDKVIDIDQSPIGRTPDRTRPPTPGCLPPSGNSSPTPRSHGPEDTSLAVFHSMYAAAVVKPVRVTD